MSEHESHPTDPTTGRASTGEAVGEESSLDTLQTYARRSIDSGAAAGVLGGLFVLRGIGALRESKWLSAVGQLLLGTLLLAIAREQYRAPVPDERQAPREPSTVEQPTTAPAEETETTERDVTRGPYERLGAAAFDEYSNQVPAPQRAFNREFLSSHEEVYWGISAADDLVVCTQSYDDLDDLPGVDYVASSRVDDERTVTVPDRIINHWNELTDTDVGVPGGTDIRFATNDTLKRHHCLAVVPEPWADEIEWEE